MIGIFGGTFDPVHYGHLKTVQHVQRALSLQRVHLVPLGQAVHREQPVASARQRLAMLQAAASGNPYLYVDDREIKRVGGSYSVDTLESIKRQQPDKTLCLIIGNDALRFFPDWHQPEKIMTLAHIVVMHRPDSHFTADKAMTALLEKHQVFAKSALDSRSAGYIFFQDVPQLNISSSGIRKRRQENLSLDGLVPESVYQLIRQWNLYSPGD